MAMHVPKAPGFAQMLKDGAKHMSGMEEAIFENISACVELAKTTKSAFGPLGLNKMVINHIGKLFVTNDAATILRELEVQHPAAKLLVMASQQQEEECGDGTNFVLIFAGALLEHAEELLRLGLSVSEVIEGYEIASSKALEVLDKCVVSKVDDLKDITAVHKCIRTSVMSKQYGHEDFLSELIARATIPLLTKSNTFAVDNVRVCKIVGAGLLSSSVITGMVFTRDVEGDITHVDNAKIVVYTCPLDIMQTETKGTVLIKTAQELKDYTKGDEDIMNEKIKSISDAGVNVIVSGGKVGDLALHYCNKYKLMVVRVNSKFDLRRVCRTVQATALPKIIAPTIAEIGSCDHVQVGEVGDASVTIFKQDSVETKISTILIRGATNNVMDDIERAVDDGVNTYKCLTKDRRLVPGAAATEIEIARQVTAFGETRPGLDQYAIVKFGQAFEAIPRALAENAGVKSNELISKLYTEHAAGKANIGFDISSDTAAVLDSVENSLLDLHNVKHWAIKFATSAACTILRVDQIIMAKPAGGPKARDNPNWDED